MVTTASRSRDYMRRLGYMSEVVEHRMGSFIRVDMLGFADTIAFRSDPKEIILIQAYSSGRAKEHSDLNENHLSIRAWLMSGGKFEHQEWKKSKGRWHVERRQISL